MSLYAIWLRRGPSIKYIRKWWTDGGSSKNCIAAYRGIGGITPHMYVRTYTQFHIFGNIFELQCLVLLVEI